MAYKCVVRGNSKERIDDWDISSQGDENRLEIEARARLVQSWNPHLQVTVGHDLPEFRKQVPSLGDKLPKYKPSTELSGWDWQERVPQRQNAYRKPKIYERYGIT